MRTNRRTDVRNQQIWREIVQTISREIVFASHLSLVEDDRRERLSGDFRFDQGRLNTEEKFSVRQSWSTLSFYWFNNNRRIINDRSSTGTKIIVNEELNSFKIVSLSFSRDRNVFFIERQRTRKRIAVQTQRRHIKYVWRREQEEKSLSRSFYLFISISRRSTKEKRKNSTVLETKRRNFFLLFFFSVRCQRFALFDERESS